MAKLCRQRIVRPAVVAVYTQLAACGAWHMHEWAPLFACVRAKKIYRPKYQWMLWKFSPHYTTIPYVATLHNQPPCQAWIHYISHIPFIETKSNRCMHHRPSQGILCIGPFMTRNQDFGHGQNYTRHHLFTKHSRDCVSSSLTCIQNSPEEWPCPRLHVALTSWEKPWLLWMTILRRYVLTSKNSYSTVKMSFSAHAWAPGYRNQSDHINS